MNPTFWTALGIIPSRAVAPWISPSPFLPTFQFYECHESGTILASPERIIDAVCAFDMREDCVVNALLSLRELPAKLLRMLGNRRTQPAGAPFGFDSFTPLQRTPDEVSMGLAGRFWRPDLNVNRVPDAQAFTALDDPRIARLVLRFQVIEQGQGARTLRTETFVHCPNTRTRLLFTPYWLAIRLASGWIRRRNLAAIERQLSTAGR
ncbi:MULTISPECIES: DUF2867 domain-containing protein [unclassified Pseudomonas]|uniref:DUF2867 domain-containing protein n=1 Tax=unclassified Pseudomonas TaxID=196821 RepID=UPI000A1F101C|nr:MULTISPECIES: DUF2867 domain-containing protein [unclassified Pseudomonas]